MKRFCEARQQWKREEGIMLNEPETERKETISEYDYDDGVDVAAIAKRMDRLTSVIGAK